MSSDAVIEVQGLGKRYEMYAQPRDRLRQMLVPPLRRALGINSTDYFKEFWALQQGDLILVALLGIAIAGGMFVVPLYAFLTTTVEKSETARTVAANNIVNSGAMVIGAVFYGLLATVGVSIADTLFLIAAACLVSAWISWKLHKACD